ncbi:MAG: hypothetical protein RIC56_13980 [Pseudomonadales bacterium]
MIGRLLLWGLAALVYAVFFVWYTPLGGPLTTAEIDHFTSLLTQEGRDPERVAALRRFMEDDDGGQFIMVNLLHMQADPPTLSATGPGADADALLGHYMEHMYPALAQRACHPVFAGTAVYGAMDLVGIEGAETWSQAALMRYRSRRDLLEIATNPAFGGRHEYKLAALEKTIAFPVEPGFYLSDPRLLLALLLLVVAGAIDALLYRRRG